MSMLKRQRELKKSEKAARKRAKRHGIPEAVFSEPKPTAMLSEVSSEAAEGEPDDEVDDEVDAQVDAAKVASVPDGAAEPTDRV